MSLRIDGHQHFWTLQRDDYDWLTPELEPLYRDFQPSDLAPILEASQIDRTVLVQAAPTVNETRYLLDLADQYDFIAGVVGWVDMEDGAAAVTILRELGRHPKFVGIRPMLQDIDDPAWIAAADTAQATEALIDEDLRFDALVKPVHLPHLLEFLRRFPELETVIDHGAKPGIAKNDWQPWADQMAQIAKQTTAFCKLSGLITESAPDQTYDDLAPYVDHLLETFGPQRLIWGSDWPVLEIAGTYSEWLFAAEGFIGSLSVDERAQIMGGNAARFYGLAGD